MSENNPNANANANDNDPTNDPYVCSICGDDILRGEPYETIGSSTVCKDCEELQDQV